jgi:hypothetical protein
MLVLFIPEKFEPKEMVLNLRVLLAANTMVLYAIGAVLNNLKIALL